MDSYKAQKLGRVKGLGDIYKSTAPLDQQLLYFGDVGIYTLAAPHEIAQIRLAGISKSFGKNGYYDSITSVAAVTRRNARTILIRNSPLMNLWVARAAVEAGIYDEEFTMGKELYSVAEERAKSESYLPPEKRNALIIPDIPYEDDCHLVMNSNMDISLFLLKEETVPYFGRFTNKKKELVFQDFTTLLEDRTVVAYLEFNGHAEHYFSCSSIAHCNNFALAVLPDSYRKQHKSRVIIEE